MECSACGHANPDDARFCSRCGTSTARVCGACSHALEDGARFCSSCGSRVGDPETSPPDQDLRRYVPDALLRKIRAASGGGAMRGERRTVTMLFADIQGSTTAAERLDPEDWAEIVNGAFEHLIAPVYRYEGTLARLQGDAILAFFGAPIAHEDDPVRAVHAGLEMLLAVEGYADEVEERTGLRIAVRVGINTGLVVVGEVGSDLRVEYTALGDAINVAARMEQTADPGTVRVTSDTVALLGGSFTTTSIGWVDVKGRRDPVHAFRVEGAVGAAPTSSSTAPLIGRRQERTRLAALLERLATGIGGVATIVGDAGLGKSRLLASLRCDAEEGWTVATTSRGPGDLAWLEGHARSFDTSRPYAPFLDLGARWFGLEGERADDTFARIAEIVTAVGADDPDTAAFLAHLVGSPLPEAERSLLGAMEAPVLHDKTTAAVVSYVEAEAARRPLLFVLEDLHWADPLSLGLVERLLAVTERAPVGLVLTLRPARDDASWRLIEIAAREAAHRHTGIELAPLDHAATAELLDLLVGDRALGPDARRRILDRADGNPLFVEQMASVVGDDDTVEVPASLAGLLTARLDRLEEHARRLVEVAAVVGTTFEPGDVAALLDDTDVEAALTSLVRAGVVVERRRLPRAVFAFRHALLQETAYNTVLLKERRRLHGRLARHLEVRRPDAPHEIAEHHLRSGDTAAAFPWLVEAGIRASRVMAVSDAIRLLTTALDHVPEATDPEEVARAHLALGEAYSLVPDLDQASAAYQSLRAYGRTCDRPSLEIRALNRLGVNAAALAGDFPAAEGYLQDARRLAEEAGDELGLAEYHANSCFVASVQGQVDRAIVHDEETARLAAQNGVEELRVSGLLRRAVNVVFALRIEEIPEALADAREAVEASGDEVSKAILRLYGDGLLLARDGDLPGSLEVLAGALEVLDRYGAFDEAGAHAQMGRLAWWLGDVGSARTHLDLATSIGQRRGHAFAVAAASATLALLAAYHGDEEDVARHRALALEQLSLPLGDHLASYVWADLGAANEALGSWEEAVADYLVGLEASSAMRFWERPRLLAGVARVSLALGDLARAGELHEQARAYADERGLRVIDPELHALAARIARQDGDVDLAAAELAAADAAAVRSGTRLVAHEVATARAEVAAAAGRATEATTYRQRARQLAEEIASTVDDPVLRGRLLGRLGGSAPSAPEPAT